MMFVKMTGGAVTEATTHTPREDGWAEARVTPRPDDTDTGTWVEGVEVVDGIPVQTWTARPWTDAELAQMSATRLAELEATGRSSQLREAARQALTTNDAYLALSPPTAAQVAAQVAALTRQASVLIRLSLGAFDS